MSQSTYKIRMCLILTIEVYPRLTEYIQVWPDLGSFFHFLRNLFWSQPPGYHLSSTSEERLELRGGLPGWHSAIRISREKGAAGSCLYLCYFGFLYHQRREVILAVHLTSWDYSEVQKKKKKKVMSLKCLQIAPQSKAAALNTKSVMEFHPIRVVIFLE